jgi:large subunit ribosomal protein L30
VKQEQSSGEKIAIIRVRGTIRSLPSIRKTFEVLKLDRQNYCVVYDKTPSIEGMAVAVKDYATYGTIDEETYSLLVQKLPEGKEKGFFRLSPPRGGFERKGTKRHFQAGGALGDRKEKIGLLIRRMIP